jgi:putative DNA primase/helicase
MIALVKNKMLGLKRAPTTMYGWGVSAGSADNLVVGNRGSVIDKALSHDVLFEHIKGGSQHKPYFDIDLLYSDSEGEEDFRSTERAVLEDAVGALLQVFPTIDRKDLYVSSYSGKEKSRFPAFNAVKKYNQNIISFHIVVGGYQCNNTENKRIAAHLKTICDMYDTHPYSDNQLFRVAGHHKYQTRDAGCRSPKLLFYNGSKWCEVTPAMKTINEVPKLDVQYHHLVTHLPDEMKPMVLPSCLVAEPSTANAQEAPTVDPPPPPAPTGEMNEELFAQLNLLPTEDRDERGKWWYVTSLVKSITEGDPTYNKRSWDAWSRPSPNYDAAENEKLWAKTEVKANALALLKKRVSQQGITPDIRKVHEAVLDSSDEVMVGLLVSLYGKFFKVVDYKSGLIYMYDHATSLWKTIHRDYLHSFLSVHFAPLREEYRSQLNADAEKFLGKLHSDPEDNEKAVKSKLSNLNTKLHLTKFAKTKTAWTKEFFAHPATQDPDFASKLNQCKDHLSVQNGLVDLRDGKLIKREFHHCISSCLQLEYDASVGPESNAAFMGFIRSIFEAEGLETDEIVTYLQVWLGYCISGYNDAQVCLILFGCGSNGKSLLQDILLTILHTSNGKMVDTWSSKLFDEAGTRGESANQATPELAKLEGCRLGLVNETAEGQTFGEGFKKLVDNTMQLPVRQLHQASKCIELITKFMMNTNHFPQIPTDPAYVRRVHVLAMLVRFVDHPNGKDQKQKDIRLRGKMLDTKQGKQAILNWMVQGAVWFFARNKEIMPLPASCQKYKDAYINQNEWMTQFTITEDKKDTMTYEEIKDTISGFTDRRVTKRELKEKLIEAGGKEGKVPNPHGGRKMGMRFVKLAQALYEVEEEQKGWLGY